MSKKQQIFVKTICKGLVCFHQEMAVLCKGRAYFANGHMAPVKRGRIHGEAFGMIVDQTNK